MIAIERAKIYPNNFNLNLSSSTSKSTFIGFGEHNILFRKLAINLGNILKKIGNIEMKLGKGSLDKILNNICLKNI